MAFFHEPRSSQAPLLNAPVSVLILIGVILAAHGLRVGLTEPWPEQVLIDYAFIPARYSAEALAAENIAPAALWQQGLTFFSYIFLHANLTHLAINSLWLLAFGPEVARRLGTAKFLSFFLFCGFVAALAHLAANWGSFSPVVGASGAVSGLMAGAIRILYGRRGFVFGEGRSLAPLFSRPIVTFTLLWVVVAVVTGYIGFGVSDEALFIAWVAHLGGFFAGLLTIGLFDALPPGKGNRHA
jgi:membrane associated rhomboid family serine protease